MWRAEVSYTKDVSKVVALKMIREDLCAQDQLRSLFIDEARITSRINHTNVAQVLDFGEVDGRPFLAIELVYGTDLFSLMAAAGEQMRAIPLDVAAFVVAEVARGLDHAHGLTDERGDPFGVVHRDVSPQNVLISYAGEVKVTDFGIARARDKLTHTETGTVMGKFRYMSPEQVRGERLDARSDIFSCGILLYELICGKQLFDGRTSAQVIDQIRYDPIPELVASRPEVDPALETVLVWTLERDLKRRCPDAATLARDLERYVHVAHPQFTRDRVAETLESLIPRAGARQVLSDKTTTLAFAGTELAKTPEPRSGASSEPGSGGGRGAAEPQEAGEDESPSPREEPSTTARAKRGAPQKDASRTAPPDPAAAQGDAPDGGVPAELMAGSSPPDPEPRQGAPGATIGETLTLARRASISSSGQTASPSAPHEAPTTLLDKGPGATAPTVHRAREPGDHGEDREPSLATTRTAGRADSARSPSRGGRARPAGKGWMASVGIFLAMVLLGGVALHLTRSLWSGSGAAGGGLPPADAGSSRTAAGPVAKDTPGALDGAADSATSTGDASASSPMDRVGKLRDLDRAIAALHPKRLLEGNRPAARRSLLLRLDRRLREATVSDRGERRLGLPCSKVPPLAAPASPSERLADLYAERLLLDPTLPAPIKGGLARELVSPGGARAKSTADGLATLRAMASPRSAAAQRALILARGRERAWCAPLAGRGGLRYLFPWAVVARDAVTRLLRLAPTSPSGRLWRRYLEAAPRGLAVTLGDISIRISSSRRQILKKDDNRIFFVTVRLRNTSPDTPAKLRPSGFSLHGVGPRPRPVGLWKPDLREPLAPGQSLTLELTFAAPLEPPVDTLVLSLARPVAGRLWLQVSSRVLPPRARP